MKSAGPFFRIRLLQVCDRGRLRLRVLLGDFFNPSLNRQPMGGFLASPLFRPKVQWSGSFRESFDLSKHKAYNASCHDFKIRFQDQTGPKAEIPNPSAQQVNANPARPHRLGRNRRA